MLDIEPAGIDALWFCRVGAADQLDGIKPPTFGIVEIAVLRLEKFIAGFLEFFLHPSYFSLSGTITKSFIR